jgi:hypothetical protein
MPRPDMPTHLIHRIAPIGIATLIAWSAHAQPAPTGQPPPNAISVEQPAIFDVTSVTGTLKETVQKEQQVVWYARRSPNERRFQLTDMSDRVPAQPGTGRGEDNVRRPRLCVRLAPGRRAETQCHRAHAGRRIDLFVDVRRVRAVRRQQPGAASD